MSRFLLTVVLLALGASVAAAQSCPGSAGRVTDPAADGGGTPRVADLVAASATVIGSNLRLSVRYATDGFNPATATFSFFLDTDQNPATGHPGIDSGGTLDGRVFGSEFLVYYFPTAAQASILRYTGPPINTFGFVGNTTLAVLTDGYDITIPLALIGSSDAPLNFKVATSASLGGNNFTGVLDVMPDIGAPPGTSCSVNAGLSVSQTGLTFRSVLGGGVPPPKSLSILSTLSQGLAFSVSASTLSGGSWLSATPASGAADPTRPAIVQVNVNPASLAPGSYYGVVTVQATNPAIPAQVVAVVLNVVPAEVNPGPIVEPTGLVFVGAPGGANPAAQRFQISNLTARAFTFSATPVSPPGANWFTIQPASGTVTPGQPLAVTVQPNITGLAAAVFTGSVLLNFSDGTSSGVNLLLVLAAGAKPSTASAENVTSSPPRADCTPARLLPLLTLLGANFNSPTAWPTPIEASVVDDCGTPMVRGSVIATFSNGDPALPFASLGAGRWSATWTPRNARTSGLVVTVSADQPETKLRASVQVSGGAPANADVPVIDAGGVVGAASYNNAPAPGALISVFGRSLAETGVNSSPQLPLETQLRNTSVILSGRLLPLIATTAGQINAMIPYDVPVNTSAPLLVRRGNAISVPEQVVLADVQPAIFSLDLSGRGQGHIYKATATDQILAGTAAPVTAGDFLVIYCAGLGAVNPALAAGAAAPTDVLTQSVNPVTVSIGGRPAEVQFAGLTPRFSGLYQVNVRVPDGVAPGTAVPVVLTVLGRASQPVTIAVR